MTGEAERDVRVGISACLVGREVRYDGRHKRDPYVTEELSPNITWIPVCPEVDIGLGVPREAIHLRAGAGEDGRGPRDVRLAGVHTADDHTAAMRSYAERRSRELAEAGLDGYVLRTRSPSCGLGDVPVHDAVSGEVVDHDRGRFAAVLTEQLPLLPVIEEPRLAVPEGRDAFLEQVCVRHRWRHTVGDDPTPSALVAFHRRHEVQILAHSLDHYRTLGRLATATPDGAPRERAGEYRRILHRSLRIPTTRSRHVNALQHLAEMVEPSDQKVLDVIVGYATGDLTWREVTETLGATASAVPDPVRRQTYLDPLAELGLTPATW